MVLEAGSLSGWVRALFWTAGFLLGPHGVKGVRELSGPSYRGPDPIHRASPLMT